MISNPTVESMLDLISDLSSDQLDELLRALAELRGQYADIDDEFEGGTAGI